MESFTGQTMTVVCPRGHLTTANFLLALGPLLTLSLSCSTFITSAAIMALHSSPSCLRPEVGDVSPPPTILFSATHLPVLQPSDCQVNFLLGFPFSPSSYLDIRSFDQLDCQRGLHQRGLLAAQHKPLPDIGVCQTVRLACSGGEDFAYLEWPHYAMGNWLQSILARSSASCFFNTFPIYLSRGPLCRFGKGYKQVGSTARGSPLCLHWRWHSHSWPLSAVKGFQTSRAWSSFLPTPQDHRFSWAVLMYMAQSGVDRISGNPKSMVKVKVFSLLHSGDLYSC